MFNYKFDIKQNNYNNMVLFQQHIFENILGYCNNFIEIQQRKKKDKLIKVLSKFDKDWITLYLIEIKYLSYFEIPLSCIIDLLIDFDFTSQFLILSSELENKKLCRNIHLLYN